MSEAASDAPGLSQDSERNKTLVDATLPQESASAAGHQEPEPSCLNQALEGEKHAEATKLPPQDVSGDVTTVTGLAYSQLEGPGPPPDTDANQNGKDTMETPAVEFSCSSSQTHGESPQDALPTPVGALGSCTRASMEKRENSQCYLEGDDETKHKEPNDVATADVPAVMEEEEEVASPPKKKRRLDEGAAEQSETEVPSQPTNAPEVRRTEADGAVFASDEPAVVCEPACFSSSDQECKPGGHPAAGLRSERQRTSDLPEAAGLDFPDYVSDSQLNAIALTEELMRERGRRSPECPSATELMCGLIQELSSLNQKVMAAHRELESVRRSGKSSRSSLR